MMIMVGILIDHDVKTSATESKERPTNKPLASLDARSLKMMMMIMNNDNDNDDDMNNDNDDDGDDYEQ